MRGLHSRDAYDGTDTGTDSGSADAPERHAGDPHSPDRAIVEDAETRTALAFAYRQRVRESIFDGRTIRAGMKGTVLEARSDGSCLAEFAFAPQTADSDGDFVQGILTRDQYEVIES